jgi:taurine dioxygenase
MQAVPLSDALGAGIGDLDLTERLADDDTLALHDHFLEHHLLCLRSAPLGDSDFARVARYFGTPQIQLIRRTRSAAVPEVSTLESTYKSVEAKPDDLTMVRLSGWHTDDSYFAVPAKATMLQALDVPESGGQTKFANTVQAYADLSPADKRRLDGLKAVHGYDTARAPGRPVARTEEEAAETPDVIHPLVRTHDDTGNKAIYFNPNRTDRIEGLGRAESDELLDWLHGHITQPRYQYHHGWTPGDILVWDNRCLIHAVNTDYPVGQRRRHQRILLKGTRPH